MERIWTKVLVLALQRPRIFPRPQLLFWLDTDPIQVNLRIRFGATFIRERVCHATRRKKTAKKPYLFRVRHNWSFLTHRSGWFILGKSHITFWKCSDLFSFFRISSGPTIHVLRVVSSEYCQWSWNCDQKSRMSLYCNRWNLTRVVQFGTETFLDNPDKRPDRGPCNYCLGIHGVPCVENRLSASWRSSLSAEMKLLPKHPPKTL
jgi:hypothetical protein